MPSILLYVYIQDAITQMIRTFHGFGRADLKNNFEKRKERNIVISVEGRKYKT